MGSLIVSPRTSSTVDNSFSKLFFRVSAPRSHHYELTGVTLSGLQFGRLGKRRDNSLEVENEVDGFAAAIDKG